MLLLSEQQKKEWQRHFFQQSKSANIMLINKEKQGQHSDSPAVSNIHRFDSGLVVGMGWDGVQS